MKNNFWTKVPMSRLLTAIILTMTINSSAKAHDNRIDRYTIDFYYQNIGYQIISESERTVAVCQDFDIDGELFSSTTYPPSASKVGDNGFLMSNGLFGTFVEIPQTVYDDSGIPYTVTELANQAINYVGVQNLILPATLERLNEGIGILPLTSIYLPENLKEIDGIFCCNELKSLYIPRKVEAIKDYSLRECGMDYLYIPSSVKTLGKDVLSGCDNLITALISGVEKMDKGCFRKCQSLQWANLPETLKSMGDGCYNDCPNLVRISLPWSKIDMNNCFNNCPSVTCIEILAAEPYPYPSNCFMDIDKSKCDLLVPEEALDKYLNADGWKDFYRINGISTAGVGAEKVSADSDTEFDAFGSKGHIKIINKQGLRIDVTSLNGEKIASITEAGDNELSLPYGVYMVSSQNHSIKVFVK